MLGVVSVVATEKNEQQPDLSASMMQISHIHWMMCRLKPSKPAIFYYRTTASHTLNTTFRLYGMRMLKANSADSIRRPCWMRPH